MVAVIEAKERPYAIAKEVLEAGVTVNSCADRIRNTYERNNGL